MEWIAQNESLIGGLVLFSVITFVGSLILVPYLVVRIPADYFVRDERALRLVWVKHPLLRSIVIVLKNLLGILVLLMGILMLVIPGQGLLTMVVGLFMMDFPGKYQLERWIVSRPAVFKSINWLRRRAGKDEMLL